MRGPKPKPAATRVLHASRRPLPAEGPPIPEAGSRPEAPVPPAPAALVKPERAYWARYAPLLAGAKVLTAADHETLADYCRACVAVDDRSRRLRAALATRDLDLRLVRLLDASLRDWVAKKTMIAGELGLTAVARTRVAWSGHPQRVDPVTKPQSKLAQLQDQAAALRRPLRVP
jgi:phage terminase small subunit